VSEFDSVTPGNIFSNMLVKQCQIRQKCNYQWQGRLWEETLITLKGRNPKSIMYLSHESYCVSESNMSSFSDAYQMHTLFRIEWQDDMDYELLKMGPEVLMVSSKKTILEFAWMGWQNIYKISNSSPGGIQNPPEYEALIYTNIQLICSMTFNVTRIAALGTSVIFTHKLYRWFHKRKLKSVSHKMHNFQFIFQFLLYCKHHHRRPLCLYCLNVLHND